MTKPNELNIVIPHQQPLQRVWRETSQESIETYELNTMTYGTASASYLATRVLRQIGLDNNTNYLAAQ